MDICKPAVFSTEVKKKRTQMCSSNDKTSKNKIMERNDESENKRFPNISSGTDRVEVLSFASTTDDKLTLSENENRGNENKLLFGIDNILKTRSLEAELTHEYKSSVKCGSTTHKDDDDPSYLSQHDQANKVLPLQVRSTYPGASMNTTPTPHHIPAVIPSAVYYNPFPWPWSDARRDKFGIVRRIGHPYQNRTPPRRKKPRTSFSRLQILELEKRFERQKYLASSERSTLAKSLKMTDAQVKTWFQNRRTKWRRQTAEEREMERQAANRLLCSLRNENKTLFVGDPLGMNRSIHTLQGVQS